MSSRLLSVFWVTQAVATVAEPPTSDPNTPAIALTTMASIADPPCAVSCVVAALSDARRLGGPRVSSVDDPTTPRAYEHAPANRPRTRPARDRGTGIISAELAPR